MKNVELSTLDALTGGSTTASCLAFGLGVAVAASNWYNPLGFFGAQLAMVGAVGCFG